MERPPTPLVTFDHDGVICDSLDVFAPVLAEGCTRARVSGVTSHEDVLALHDGKVSRTLARIGRASDLRPEQTFNLMKMEKAARIDVLQA